ncbi:tRNA-modifying protein YgfZ [Colwellia sp. 1_MG-2023]|uniref:tRNA-modifying protein YgfZ n=1 Tax=unclassified Colwellia TaxID=196834 RepID=UPI001C093805|nr:MULTISPECIES: tRNA-modifying protein YgfZ [unclassified Colwellia]MBU2923243.1 tRNA-modifying protein YgfZ [Colwellia sp. C2M11]MDO6486646.1 tRNA-modifying protein YgfZ [Colwellia sp. 6_MG-2023]MDO6651327.1 tRNA-modifying protein YgfZ [Colwellia sp. 3_MG-2023]MDO6664250.1 tRNA-modifying protein YgfZ [Colwellia sp. 2_MG-2023]MDO6688636.1 tRNA-modifying protein YgfZ [Colwellia sp. 1_MG-2023]
MSINLEANSPTLEQLPDTYLVSLNHYSAIALTGEEKSKYLQGQVTCDVTISTEHSLLVGAHCDAKGKTFSVFRLLNRNDAHLLIQPESSIESSMAELKKFGVFAKVDILKADDLAIFALIGDDAETILKNNFSRIPDSLNPVVQSDSTTLVYISGRITRYLLIDSTSRLENIIQGINLPVYSNNIWNLLEISEGFVQLSHQSSGEYVPQMLNLQAIHGISFTKGCYLGQETVARMQYLGKNKKALFSLTTLLNQPVQNDDIIEKQLGENWRKAGDVLSTYQADDGTCYIQAVLGHDVDSSTQLRIKSQPDAKVAVETLPYSLTVEE